MPYQWTTPARAPRQELMLWPHNALSDKGFAAMILGFFSAALIPLVAVLGTMILWGLLPFVLLATAGLYYALRRNNQDRQIVETLTISPVQTSLTRRNPDGAEQSWDSNTYWVTVSMHETGGPVPNYVTLKGAGREVEIGAFLSEDERKVLYTDLVTTLRRVKDD